MGALATLAVLAALGIITIGRRRRRRRSAEGLVDTTSTPEEEGVRVQALDSEIRVQALGRVSDLVWSGTSCTPSPLPHNILE